jgi:dipeptidyl aminopeptidase/acylaminoacyl peptidase
VLVALNRRDPRFFDLYRANLATGALAVEAENPGDVLSWTPDAQSVIRGATAFDTTTGASVIRVRDGVGEPWRDVLSMPFERALFSGQFAGGSLIAAFGKDGKSLLVHSALGNGYGRLVRIDAATGKELEIVAAHPKSDLPEDPASGLLVDEKTHKVLAVEFDPGAPEWTFLDNGTRDDFARIAQAAPGFAEVASRDSADRRWILAIENSDAPDRYVLYDRDTEAVTLLWSTQPALASATLARKQVVSIKARDGLAMVSYLTVPLGVAAKNLPLVLLIHGGPWYRDSAFYEREVHSSRTVATRCCR